MPHWIRVRTVTGVGLLAAASLLAGGLTSCVNYFGCGIDQLEEDVTAADLNGRYVGSEYGMLNLEPHGKLSFRDWRHHDDVITGESTEVPYGTGSWSLTRAGRDDRVQVSLTASTSASEDFGVAFELLADGPADSPTLYQYIGDPDTCDINTFERD
ncbi:hypothetical protein [Streptomyces sp. MAR4 CNX-425]|uniref:hypothetical protein n=1 Tax=Streptomyces sp. MAR4 CNX-425 TaxID=3406343 RepID=UPI003B50F3D3